MDQTVIRETLSITTKNVTEDDKALGAEFNRLAWMAMEQAERYLVCGPEDARIAVTRDFIKAMSRLSAADSSRELEEHRVAFMSYITGEPSHEPVAITATSQQSDHQDE